MIYSLIIYKMIIEIVLLYYLFQNCKNKYLFSIISIKMATCMNRKDHEPFRDNSRTLSCLHWASAQNKSPTNFFSYKKKNQYLFFLPQNDIFALYKTLAGKTKKDLREKPSEQQKERKKRPLFPRKAVQFSAHQLYLSFLLWTHHSGNGCCCFFFHGVV